MKLLDTLAMTARNACRSVYNDASASAHVESKVLQWLLQWNPDTCSVRKFIAGRAANEARKLLWMRPDERRMYYRLAPHDIPRIVRRPKGAQRHNPLTDNDLSA